MDSWEGQSSPHKRVKVRWTPGPLYRHVDFWGWVFYVHPPAQSIWRTFRQWGPLLCRFEGSAGTSPARRGQQFPACTGRSSQAPNAHRTNLEIWESQIVSLLWSSGMQFSRYAPTFEETLYVDHHGRKPEDWGCRFLRNVATNRQKYTASHPTRL
jgi:hypothetical protein